LAYGRAKAEALWFQWNYPDAPWITADAVRLLHHWLRPSHVGLEWGAGRSTHWLAGRVNRLVSVEHNPAWVGALQRRIARAGAENVELRHIPRGDDRYPRAVADGEYDFVLVDGVRRDECALAAIRHVRPGGVLIIDDAERYLPLAWRPAGLPGCAPDLRRDPAPSTPLWADAAEALRHWPLVWTSDGVSDTCIAVRPTATPRA
jgi:SAM-dependent methyltransferase